jgi:hypothetical protein
MDDKQLYVRDVTHPGGECPLHGTREDCPCTDPGLLTASDYQAARMIPAGGRESGERFAPWWKIALWNTWDFITWPRTVRQLKRAGFRRTGWMTWGGEPAWTDSGGWEEDPDG